MKHTIRLVALLLTLLMLSGVALASEQLGDKSATAWAEIYSLNGMPLPELPIVDAPLTLTVMFPRQTNHGDFSDMWFVNEVERRTGIRLEIQGIESSGWTEKMNLAFVSGDYTDIFLHNISLNNAAKFGMAGMLLPLEDLIAEHAPNATKILETIPEIKKTITASDGHIYAMPAVDTPMRDMVHKVGFINTKWLENLGLEHPATVDELYDVLIAIRDNDANGNGDATDEIPLSYVYNGDGYNAGSVVLYAFGFVHPRHDVVDDEYKYVPMQENFRQYLIYMNRLYEEGLLDSEVFTQTQEQYQAKLSGYRVFFSTPEMQSSFADQDVQVEYSLIGPMTSEFSQVKMWAAQASEKPGSGGLVITDKCPDPVAAIKLLDFFYSEEGSFMIKCGPEAGTWDGEGGWTRITAEDGSISYKVEWPDKYNSFWDFRCANGLMNMPFLYTDVHAQLVLGGIAWSSHLSQSVFDSGAFDVRRQAYPQGATFTEDEQDVLAPFVLLDSYVDQMVAKFITGITDVEDDAEWQAYLSDIEAMDVGTLIETRQAAYDRWNSN